MRFIERLQSAVGRRAGTGPRSTGRRMTPLARATGSGLRAANPTGAEKAFTCRPSWLRRWHRTACAVSSILDGTIQVNSAYFYPDGKPLRCYLRKNPDYCRDTEAIAAESERFLQGRDREGIGRRTNAAPRRRMTLEACSITTSRRGQPSAAR